MNRREADFSSYAHGMRGFTTIELLSTTMLTFLFVGGLSSTWLVVTRTLIAWDVEWSMAATAHWAIMRISTDVELAKYLEVTSDSVFVSRTGGIDVFYRIRSDGVSRNDLPMSIRGARVTDLRISKREEPVQDLSFGDEVEITLTVSWDARSHVLRRRVDLYGLTHRIDHPGST